jgi:hypothetical protein
VCSRFCAGLLSCQGAHGLRIPLFHFTLPPGPHAVGLRVVDQYDESRIWLPLTDEMGELRAGNRARSLQTLIWYPAGKTGAKKMTVGDYGKLTMTETSFDKPDPGTGDGWRKAMRPTLGDATLAVRDAPAAPGRYLNLAAQFADRLLLLDNGRILADGPPADVLTGVNLHTAFAVSPVLPANPATGKAHLVFESSVDNR